MWIDAHAHLVDLCSDHLAAQLDEAALSGVKIVLSTATSIANAHLVAQQCGIYSMVWGAVGISPFDVENLPVTWQRDLEQLSTLNKIIAIGEIGIDFTNPSYPPPDVQLPVFERQLEIARKNGLPAVIHSRGAETDAVAICKNNHVTDAVFHCFTGSRDALAAVIDAGYYLSLSGIVTFKNFDLRRYLHDVPLDRLLVETDCPYLAPVPHRGKTNRPAWVRYVGEEVARLLGKTAEQVETQMEENFRRVFSRFRDEPASVY